MDVVSYLLAKAGGGSTTPSESVSCAGVLTLTMIDTEPVAVTEDMLSEVTVIELNGGI